VIKYYLDYQIKKNGMSEGQKRCTQSNNFIAQLMHTNCKILRLLKIVKIIKAAPTCFGSHETIIREPHPVFS